MPKDNREKQAIKVTDKRIFTADGEIREEFRNDVRPSDPVASIRPSPSESSPEPAAKSSDRPARPAAKPAADPRAQKPVPPPESGDRRRTMENAAPNPGTPFSNFVEPLIAQAYISLGMMRNPYQPQTTVDAGAARQMIDILSMLQEKTVGNLTDDESELLRTHLGQLKLAYVQVTKSLT